MCSNVLSVADPANRSVARSVGFTRLLAAHRSASDAAPRPAAAGPGADAPRPSRAFLWSTVGDSRGPNPSRTTIARCRGVANRPPRCQPPRKDLKPSRERVISRTLPIYICTLSLVVCILLGAPTADTPATTAACIWAAFWAQLARDCICKWHCRKSNTCCIREREEKCKETVY